MQENSFGRKRPTHLKRLKISVEADLRICEGWLVVNDFLQSGIIYLFLKESMPLSSAVQVRVGSPWDLGFTGIVEGCYPMLHSEKVISIDRATHRIKVQLDLSTLEKQKLFEDFSFAFLSGKSRMPQAA